MIRRILLSLAVVLFSLTVFSQETSTPNVPRLLHFGGTIRSADGTPRTGVVGVMFSLYADQQGGTALWTELQNVTLDANGQYAVLLGSQHSAGVPAELFTTNEARWLGIQAEAEPEQARVLLVSVPYALKAGDAETLGGKPISAFLLNPNADTSETATSLDGNLPKASTTTITPYLVNTGTSGGTAGYTARWLDSQTLGTGVLYDNGTNVGVGTSSPAFPLTISNSASQFAVAVYGPAGLNGISTFVNGTSKRSSLFINSAGAAVLEGWEDGVGPLNFALGPAGGNVGIGTSTPPFKLSVVGPAGANVISSQTAGTGMRASLYLNSSNTAVLEGWQDGTGPLNLIVNPSGGNVGIGTSSPGQKFSVGGTIESTSGGFKFPNGSVQTTAGVTGVNASAGINGNIASGLLTLTGDTTYLQRRISGTCATGTALASVNADGTVGCNTVSGGGGGSLTFPFSGSGADNPPSVQGVFRVTDTTNGPANTQQGPPDPNAVPGAVLGLATGTGIVAGIVGKVTGPDGVGVVGLNTSTVGDDTPVIVSWSLATSGKTTMFDGMANSPDAKGIELSFAVPTSRNVIDVSVGNTTQLFSVSGNGDIQNSGQITSNGPINTNGSIHANGTISTNTGFSAPSKFFKIDHPLDPSDKWLYHTSVESPDMMNIYNGVAVLNGQGQAWVQLPDYFEALNQDFRYQLTSIGAPGPNLYIAKEISANRFRIAGGKPHAKVSWQVTGIRHDAWANAHRSPVELDKAPTERGTYMAPELFKPQSGSVAKMGEGAKNASAPTGSENK